LGFLQKVFSVASDKNLAVVIMAGGAGTRFWPLSTEAHPKQFLTLLSGRSLLQESFDRVRDLVSPEHVFVLTNERFVDICHQQLPELPLENIIGEPLRRDTAAAVALGALLIERKMPDAVMAVLTSDHRIAPIETFQSVLESAVANARHAPGSLYTFGIAPAYPATSYGYLHRGEPIDSRDSAGVAHFRLRQFREKPDEQTASEYVDSGEYYWNSGMFVWSIEAILSELERQLPDHLRSLKSAVELHGSAAFAGALASAFEALEAISIDFGVMEGARDVRCVEANFDWSDVGGWIALEPYLTRTPERNAVRGALHALDSEGCIVFAEDEDVALVGVSDLVVVRAGKRTLVCHRDRAEDIKALVNGLPAHLK
jgi:mannose-1-phosphate guanylyltransferase